MWWKFEWNIAYLVQVLPLNTTPKVLKNIFFSYALDISNIAYFVSSVNYVNQMSSMENHY